MKNSCLKSTKKKKISEFNKEEIRGWIIDNMNQIESKIDFIIVDYFKPNNHNEFTKIILNSSIITIGGKCKILRNIKKFDKNIISMIQKIAPIRNSFAHLAITDSIKISVNADGNSQIKDVSSQIEVMNSSGLLKYRDTDELIKEFFDLNKEIREYLNSF